MSKSIEVNGFEITEEKLKERYDFVKQKHKNHLKENGVGTAANNMHKLGGKLGTALSLMALGYEENENKWWRGDQFKTVFEFIGINNPNTDFQYRHLRMQKGWDVLLGSKHKNQHDKSCKFRSLENPYPDYIRDRRGTFSSREEVLEKYDYECPLTGKKHSNTNPLEMGHMDPTKPLTPENCVPQHPEVNKTSKDKFHFNKRGIPTKASKNHAFDRVMEALKDDELSDEQKEKLKKHL